VEDKLKQGETLFAEGKIEDAEKCFLDLLDKHPENAELLNNLGVISHARGSFEKSESYLLKALAVKDDHLNVLLNLSDLYQSANRWKEAAFHLEKYIMIENKDHNIFNQLAMVYLEAENTQNARSALEQSLELKPDQDIILESLKKLKNKEQTPSYLPRPSSFRAAFAEINITPNVSKNNPVFLQGMGGPPRKAIEVSNPLMMQLLLLEDDHFTKILFVTADLFGFGREIIEKVRTFAAPWGIEPEGVILNASHTHYAPGTISNTARELGPFYEDYSNQIAQNIGQHLPLLYDRLEECDLFWGKTEAQVGVNRRLKKDGKVDFAPNKNGYYDKHTPFLVVHFKNSDSKIFMVNHGCHPTGLGSENNLSADFPGYMRQSMINSGTASGVMFFQGAAGNTKESIKKDKHFAFCEDSDSAKRNGERLAKKIIESFENEVQTIRGSFFCSLRQVTIPLKKSPQAVDVKQIKDNQEEAICVREWANSLLEKYPKGNYPSKLITEIQVISLGEDILFITLPGEPVAEIARDLRGLSNNPSSTFVLGYTNGLVGYFPTDTMIEEGGYEIEASPFVYLLPSFLDKGTHSAILSSTEKCMKAVLNKDKPNGYGRFHLTQKKQKAFFVLSAGRCGTMTLAHLLNTATNARVWHHPQPDPIKESLSAYRGGIDKRKAFWKARYPIIHKTWSEGLIHGETDLLMTPFCDMISEEIPDSKFIVMVRDPRDFIRSGMRRNYYCGHPWDFGRLRPQEGTEEFERWNKLDQFGKICWLWVKTYSHIDQMKNQIDGGRVIIVRFEDLISGVEKTKEIFDFLNLKGFDHRRISKILASKLNAQTYGSFSEPKDWPSEFHETVQNISGSIAKKYGYSNLYEPVNSHSLQRKQNTKYSPSVKSYGNSTTVSIAVPLYKIGPEFNSTIESLLSQDYENIELILSDHGSDQYTKETCLNYVKMDNRISYYPTGVNNGSLDYWTRSLELSNSRYFMFGSHHNIWEKSFISRCLETIREDDSIALVYSRTKLINSNSEVIGIANDNLMANHKDPIRRFRKVIWNLGMCNAWYGLFRRNNIRKTRSLKANLYRGYDNLFLAEISLFGKITQIDDVLFKRRLTRNTNLSLEDNNSEIIAAWDPQKLSEGITLPHCRLTYAHCELIKFADIKRDQKKDLINEIIECFRMRYGSKMVYEINRAISLIRQNCVYYSWDKKAETEKDSDESDILYYFHINNLLKHLQEALFIYPEHKELRHIYNECVDKIMGYNPQNITIKNYQNDYRQV